MESGMKMLASHLDLNTVFAYSPLLYVGVCALKRALFTHSIHTHTPQKQPSCIIFAVKIVHSPLSKLSNHFVKSRSSAVFGLEAVWDHVGVCSRTEATARDRPA